MTARRGHQGRRARLHDRGPPLTSPRRGGRKRRRPSGRSPPPAEEGERAKGAARRAPGSLLARGGPPGARSRGTGPGAPGAGVSLAPSPPFRTLAASPSLPLRASGPPRACAQAPVPAKRPAFRRFTPARGRSHRAPFFSLLVRGLGRIIGERELGFCQSLEVWVGLEVGRGWVIWEEETDKAEVIKPMRGRVKAGGGGTKGVTNRKAGR